MFVTIFILLQHVSRISSLDKEMYELFVQLIKGEFTQFPSRVGQSNKSLHWYGFGGIERNCPQEEEYSVMTERARLRWLKTVSNTYIWIGRYNHCLSFDATTMVSKNCPIIGEHVVIIFLTQ